MKNRHLLFTIAFLSCTVFMHAQGVGVGTSSPSANAALTLTPSNGNGKNLIFRDLGDNDRFEMRTDGNSWALANASNGSNFLAAVINEGTFVYTDFYVSGSRTGLNSFQPSVDAALTVTPFNATGKNIVFRDLGDNDRFEMRTDGNSWALANASNGANFIAAVYNQGVFVQTDFSVTGAKNFVMDHPLAPADKLLRHACMESPEVLNVYSGTVALDEAGRAVIELPDYFEAINKDFRYQLTAIGGAAPQLHVAQEVESNSFHVAGGLPGMKVSWQVTGVRNDAYFQNNPYQAVSDKPEKDKGRYYYPEGYGMPSEMGINRR
jgi:hypothetical protein